MSVFVFVNGLEVSAGFRVYVTEALELSLAHFGRRVIRVNVYLQDVNGSKGGVDKLCRVVVMLRRQPSLVIEDRDEDLLPLVNRVIDRVGQTAQRTLSRRRSRSGSISMSGQ